LKKNTKFLNQKISDVCSDNLQRLLNNPNCIFYAFNYSILMIKSVSHFLIQDLKVKKEFIQWLGKKPLYESNLRIFFIFQVPLNRIFPRFELFFFILDRLWCFPWCLLYCLSKVLNPRLPNLFLFNYFPIIEFQVVLYRSSFIIEIFYSIFPFLINCVLESLESRSDITEFFIHSYPKLLIIISFILVI